MVKNRILAFSMVLSMLLSVIILPASAGDIGNSIYSIDIDEYSKTTNATDVTEANFNSKAAGKIYAKNGAVDGFGGLHVRNQGGKHTITLANGTTSTDYEGKKVLKVDDTNSTSTNDYSMVEFGKCTADTAQRWFDEDFVVSFDFAVHSLGGSDIIDIGMYSANPDAWRNDIAFRVQNSGSNINLLAFGLRNAENTAYAFKTVKTFTAGEYYTISLAYDVDNQTADLYVDGVLVANDRAWMNNSTATSTILTESHYLEGFFIKGHNKTTASATVYDVASIKAYKGTVPVEYAPTSSVEKPTEGIVFRGVQESATGDAVRFVSTLDKNYYAYGYNVSYTYDADNNPGTTNVTKASNDIYCTKIYKSITATTIGGEGSTLIKASDFNSRYICAYAIKGVPTTGTITFTVTPFVYTDVSTRVPFGAYTVTYTDGAFVNCTPVSAS